MANMTSNNEHRGELTPESKQMLAEGYQFPEEDKFKCTCGADVYVQWDSYKKEYIPRWHPPKPSPKPYNSGKRVGRKA
jgi:DUF2075 family protein